MKNNILNNTGHKIFHRKRLPLYIYLLLLIAATVNVSLRGGAFSYVVFYVFLLYLPVSFLFMFYASCMFNYYQETGSKFLSKNAVEKYRFTMEDTSLLPIGGLSFDYDERLMNFTDDFTKESFSLLHKEREELETGLKVKYAGSYDVGLTHYSMRDMFGIIRLRRKIKLPVRVSVIPTIRELTAEDIRQINELREGGNLYNIDMSEGTLGNDIRKYIPGDRLADVHWKNYARTGEMYVRLPDKQEIDILCIALITEAIEGTIEELEQRDKFLEYIVSVGRYFGMNKKPVIFFYYNSGVQSYVVDSPASFNNFYRDAAGRIGLKTAAGHREEILTTAAESFMSILVYNEDGCVLKRAFDDN